MADSTPSTSKPQALRDLKNMGLDLAMINVGDKEDRPNTKLLRNLSRSEKENTRPREDEQASSNKDASSIKNPTEIPSTSPARRCGTCAKHELELPPNTTFKICSRCKSRRYCSAQCQKADWKTHKQSCVTTAPSTSTSSVKPTIPAAPEPFSNLSYHHNSQYEREYEEPDDEPTYSDPRFHRCTFCATPRSSLPSGQSLKACAQCKVPRYCSRACQKKDWPTHKPNCCAPANTPNLGWSQSREGNMVAQMMVEELLHDVPERVCYTHLIDIYRLRVDEEFKFGNKRGIYNGDLSERSTLDPLPDFKRFLDKAERCPGLLPSWWSREKREECEIFGDKSVWRGWDGENIEWRGYSDLRVPVDHEAITKQYGDWMRPMLLQQIGEKIEGTKAFAPGVSVEELMRGMV